eukprot:gnl/MRDRNA2_/MRDRNA2_74554_c0_seq1.p1 gnl/MRDRNA2_/MRDRNA2_74554_c0~~gnl/MRDRNA2_/MRDRNA2_74554_c0_seq1.p1  ORF type:complete len:180 (-),score=41.82 gnl/MRDRNA2_/MRDRNA2_74554_c0_seq1:114-653(-)
MTTVALDVESQTTEEIQQIDNLLMEAELRAMTAEDQLAMLRRSAGNATEDLTGRQKNIARDLIKLNSHLQDAYRRTEPQDCIHMPATISTAFEALGIPLENREVANIEIQVQSTQSLSRPLGISFEQFASMFLEKLGCEVESDADTDLEAAHGQGTIEIASDTVTSSGQKAKKKKKTKK